MLQTDRQTAVVIELLPQLKIYTLTNGLTDIQKSDLYSEVALAKKDGVIMNNPIKGKILDFSV